MFHDGRDPPALPWQQEHSRCKEAFGWMSDLYGCHFGVTAKQTGAAGLNRTGGFVRALSASVTRSLTLLGHTANEVGGQRAPGSPFLIYSDEEEDLKRGESRPRNFWQVSASNHRGPPRGSRASRLNHSVICGRKIPTTPSEKQENRSRSLKYDSHPYVFLSLFKHEGVGPLLQPLMYPSLLTVRFGTVWQKFITYLNTSVTEFKGWPYMEGHYLRAFKNI